MKYQKAQNISKYFLPLSLLLLMLLLIVYSLSISSPFFFICPLLLRVANVSITSFISRGGIFVVAVVVVVVVVVDLFFGKEDLPFTEYEEDVDEDGELSLIHI